MKRVEKAQLTEPTKGTNRNDKKLVRQDNTNQNQETNNKELQSHIVKDPELPRAERRNKIEIQPVYIL